MALIERKAGNFNEAWNFFDKANDCCKDKLLLTKIYREKAYT
jgi:hypothetical protein